MFEEGPRISGKLVGQDFNLIKMFEEKDGQDFKGG
jgi:hypothetical protein